MANNQESVAGKAAAKTNKWAFLKNVDWQVTLIPIGIILVLSAVLLMFPAGSEAVIEFVRHILVNRFGFLYMIFGLVILGALFYIALSKYGKIQLGALEKPRYKTFSWGAMIFTSTMAADILYWALIEWAYYYNESPFGMTMDLASKQEWAATYPLFHWGPTAWAFYLLPAAAYGYMFFVKKRQRQKMSEACRPLLGKRTDGWAGKLIDILSIMSILVAIATTFSLATPLLSLALSTVTGLPNSNALTIAIIIAIALVYTITVFFEMKGISKLANLCIVAFGVLIGMFLISGDGIYMIESGLSGLGNMAQNFLKMSTWMDPLRVSGADGVAGMPQNWTVFYWAYWIAWFVATPFFIAKISEGRTIRQTLLGGLSCGLLGTFTSFIVFGNYGLGQQVQGTVDAAGMLAEGLAPSEAIIEVFKTLPLPEVAMVVLIIAMICFYATTFDAIALVVAGFSYKKLHMDAMPDKRVIGVWAVIFTVLPIALIFTESTLSMLQMICIIAALPMAIIMTMVVISFVKELRKDWKDKKVVRIE